MDMKTLLMCADDYADRFGWAVVPVSGKSANCCQWQRFQHVRPNRRQRIGLFTQKNKNITGLAVITGNVSDGLRVRDYDDEGAYTRWANAYPDWAKQLPTVRTHRGYHVYFRANMPDGKAKDIFADGELLMCKHVVVLPPSPHPDGGQYDWILEPKAPIPLVDDVAEAGLRGPAPDVAPEALPLAPEVMEAIQKTLPERAGRRHDLIFDFARRLKGIPGLDDSATALNSYIAEWHRQALPVIRTKDFLTTQIAFWDSWKNAKTPLTDEGFWGLINESLKSPDPKWFENWFFPPCGKRLFRVCQALQQHAGSEPFYLSARKAGEAVGVAAKDGHALLKLLVRDGRLQMVEKGTYKDGMATTWRCLNKEL
jgi:hypothetical protein